MMKRLSGLQACLHDLALLGQDKRRDNFDVLKYALLTENTLHLKYGLKSQRTLLFYVFVFVYGNLCSFAVSGRIVFLDNEMVIQWKT